MARRFVIGAAWWLAVAYGLQLGAGIYGLPLGIGPIVAIPLAVLVATLYRRPLGRPADRRRIYRVPEETGAVSAKPATWTGR